MHEVELALALEVVLGELDLRQAAPGELLQELLLDLLKERSRTSVRPVRPLRPYTKSSLFDANSSSTSSSTKLASLWIRRRRNRSIPFCSAAR
jgi:hypothetical protein